MMNKELEKYYEAQFDMFASQGWKDLIEQVKEIEAAVNRISGTNTAEQFYERKGELKQILWLLNWEESCKEAYKGLTDETTV